MNELTFRVRDLSLVTVRHVFGLAWNAGKQFAEPFEIVLRPIKAKRTKDQNRRYWALLREVAASVWLNGRRFSDEVWHEHFKRELIGREEIVLPSGEVELRGISTTTLNVADMSRYMDSISHWCVEQGFPLEEAA